MTSTGTLGVTYAEAATVGTVAEIKKQPPSDVTPSITDNLKHIPANDLPGKVVPDEAAEISKKSIEGSGDGKAVKSQPSSNFTKPSKASDSVKAAGDSISKVADREVFVPAPPPATNAWAKRLQNQAPTTRLNAAPAVAPPANAVSADNKQPERKVESTALVTAAVVDASTKPVASGVGKTPEASGVVKTPEASGVVKTPEASGVGKTPSSSGTVRQSCEDDLPPVKSPAPCNSYASAAASDDGKHKSEVSHLPNAIDSKLKQQDSSKKVANTIVEAPRVPPGKTGASSGKNVESVKSAVKKEEESCENISKSSLEPEVPVSEKQTLSSGDDSAKTEEKRKWNSNRPAKTTGLNDSGDWPSLQKNDKSPKRHINKLLASPSEVGEQSPSLGNGEAGEQTEISSATGAECETLADEKSDPEQTTSEQNHTDSGIEEPSSKDTPSDGQSKTKKKGAKQKWLPYEIEIPKTRRRRGVGRTRTDSRGEQQDVNSRDSRQDTVKADSREHSRDNGTMRDAGRRQREVRGGRDYPERYSSGVRRNRRDLIPDKDRVDPLEEAELSESAKPTISSSGDVPHQQQRNDRNSAAGVSNVGPSGRMGYQGSRRAAHRGRGIVFGYSGRGRYAPVWGTATATQYPFMDLGIFDTQYQYYSVCEPTPTYFAPIVSQSDYYTSILADESAKKLIAQQIEYYFSTENLVKDFYLRRQMDNDGWIAVQLLASFRRVRIHTGTVNVELIVESMANSKIVEISSDRMRMRAREEPAKWSLRGIEPTTFSSLSVNVPEFVPGKLFKAPDAGGNSTQSPGTKETTTDVEPAAPVVPSEDPANSTQTVDDGTLPSASKEEPDCEAAVGPLSLDLPGVEQQNPVVDIGSDVACEE